MLRLLAIHGISTPGKGFSSSWAEPLFAAGLPVRIDEAVWPSTGSVVGDLTRVMTDDGFRRAALQAVRDAVARLASTTSHASTPRGIVAHSLGCVLAAEVLARGPEDWRRIPLLMLGSPHSHPLYRIVLERLFDAPPVGPVPHLWNEDDGVCAAAALGLPREWRVRHPDWTAPERVAVAGRRSLFGEHMAAEYLASTHAHAILGGWRC
jgi:hypothetical protein